MAARHDLEFQNPLTPFNRSRLLRLCEAARDDGHLPLPEVDSFRAGELRGARQAADLINGLVTPTSLAEYVDPQYTFGYYEGIRNVMDSWASFHRDKSLTAARPGTADEAEAITEPMAGEAGISDAEQALIDLIALKCQYIDTLVSSHRGTSENRHFGLQAYAFSERRDRAMRLVTEPGNEPAPIRLARLSKASEALDCSLEFFRGLSGTESKLTLAEPLELSDKLANQQKPGLLAGLAALFRRVRHPAGEVRRPD